MSVVLVGSPVSLPDWEALRRAGSSMRFVDLRDLLCSFELAFADGVETASVGRFEADLRGATVWYNPGTFDLLERNFVRGDTKLGFVARQFSSALVYFEHWLDDNARCIDSPASQRKWSNKPTLLRALNIALPTYVVETRISATWHSIGHVIKRLSESRLIDDNNMFFARVLDQDALSRLAGGEPTPMLFQPAIDAAVEYRTYCFGSETVTIRMPRIAKSSVVDIHFYPEQLNMAKVVPSPIPGAIWQAIHDALDLKFFAVDYFVIGGLPQILEVNPLFSWSWLPEQHVAHLTSAIKRFQISSARDKEQL